MIHTARQLIELSKIESQQQAKNKWKENRDKAYNFYKGRTAPYLKEYFKTKDGSTPITDKLPIPKIELTKRIIDRISLVYMVPPIREYSNDNLKQYQRGKDFKMQRAEKLTNLLENILIKPTWRNDGIEYDLIRDFEPIFGDDPLTPIAITYPLQVKDSVLDTTPELWAYWDENHHYTYEKATGKTFTTEDNPEMANPYQMLPFVECYRDGKPEASYLDTDASPGLIAANEVVNMAEFNKIANVQFQSFGFGYVSGTNIDYDKLEIGPDKWSKLGHDGQLNITSPPNTIPALNEAIREHYKLIAQNYGLDASFAEGTSAESGISRRLRMQELLDNRAADVIRWREIENNIHEIEARILAEEITTDAGQLINIDYSESVEILSAAEQRAKWDWELSNGYKSKAMILMEMDADKYPDIESAQEFLDDIAGVEAQPEAEASPLLQALTTPV